MQEEEYFSLSNTVLANVSELAEKQSVLEERRICEIAELAYSTAEFAAELISSDSMSYIEVISLISEMCGFPQNKPHRDVLMQNFDILRAFLESLSRADKCIFARLLTEKLVDLGFKITEKEFLLTKKLPENFVYVKNSFSDEAYDVFLQDFTDPRVRYADTFRDAIRLVLDGTVTYALLPLEERGVRIPTVSQLIFASDLKIASVTPVFGFDGTADMKYALVSRTCSYPSLAEGDDRYLELRLAADDKSALPELVLALGGFDTEIHRINSVFFDTEEGREEYYSLILKKEGGDFSMILTYLTLFVPTHTVVGLYKNLEL